METKLITSAFDEGNQMTVDDMMKDPTYIPSRVIETLKGSLLTDYVFRNGGANNGSVAYTESAHDLALNGGPEDIAEFGEFPVFDPERGGKTRMATSSKIGLSVRVSREMRLYNKVDQMGLRVRGAQNTMLQAEIKALTTAFKNADVNTVAATKAWNKPGADPLSDLTDAEELILAAAPENAKEHQSFGYQPKVILANPIALNRALRQESIQRFFVGDMAHANPALKGYRGLQGITLNGLEVAYSRRLPADEVYVLEPGVCGFYSDAEPLSATPFYEEGGASGAGGPRQSWRADFWRSRIIAVDNPKAVTKITGVYER